MVEYLDMDMDNYHETGVETWHSKGIRAVPAGPALWPTNFCSYCYLGCAMRGG